MTPQIINGAAGTQARSCHSSRELFAIRDAAHANGAAGIWNSARLSRKLKMIIGRGSSRDRNVRDPVLT